MRNYIVRYPGKKSGVIVLATHYETNYPLRDINFIGANDGACTTALLIEIGHYLRAHPPEGASVWLLFDDGAEPREQCCARAVAFDREPSNWRAAPKRSGARRRRGRPDQRIA